MPLLTLWRGRKSVTVSRNLSTSDDHRHILSFALNRSNVFKFLNEHIRANYTSYVPLQFLHADKVYLDDDRSPFPGIIGMRFRWATTSCNRGAGGSAGSDCSTGPPIEDKTGGTLALIPDGGEDVICGN